MKDQLAEIEKEIDGFIETMWKVELRRQEYEKRVFPLRQSETEEQYKRRIYMNDVCGPLLKLKWKKQGFLLGTISQLKESLDFINRLEGKNCVVGSLSHDRKLAELRLDSIKKRAIKEGACLGKKKK